MSLREKFKSVKLKDPVKHWVPEIEDYVYIPQKTVAEQNEFEAMLRKRAKGDIEAAADVVKQMMLIKGCVDAAGVPIWSERDIGDIAQYPIPMVEGIIKAIRAVNDYSDSDIEEMAKNVGATADGDSSAVSP